MRLKWLRLLVPVSAVLALAFVLSSCGSSRSGETSASSGGTGVPDEFAAVTAAPDNAKQGGDLTVLNEGDIDYMDPGAAYYQVTYTLDLAAQRGLLGVAAGRHRAPARPRHGAAQGHGRRQDDHLHDQG